MAVMADLDWRQPRNVEPGKIMHWERRREAFRTLLSGSECVYPASVFDPISARIAEDLGYEVGMFAGSVASMAVLGAPDLMVLTLTEFAEQAHRINRAGSLPLIVDADHGYGNALSVQRTVDELETAGVAAMTIEDTLLPTPYGGGPTTLIPTDEAAGKMRAAVAARQDEKLVIMGRTSLKAASLDEAADRVKAYQDCGVDAIFLRGMSSWEQLETLHSVARVPFMLGGPAKELLDRKRLAEHGVRICLQGHRPFMAAVQAVHDTLKALRTDDHSFMPKSADETMMLKLKRDESYRSALKEFVGASS